MATYTLYSLEESNITVSGGQQLSGITQGHGGHLVGETITLNSADWVAVSVDDDDSDFGDSDGSQTLTSAITYNGTSYAAGRVVEAEYRLTLTDPDGNTYEALAFNINEPSGTTYGTVEGLSFVGGPGGFPPVGVALTVTNSYDFPNFAYSTLASPICFTTGCGLETPDGPIPVETLAPGDLVRTKDHGPQAIRWIGRRTVTPGDIAQNDKLRPIRIRAGALGAGLPRHDLRVSRQHRMLIRSKIALRMFDTPEVLVPAIRMVGLPGIFPDKPTESFEYVHVLFDRHEIIYAEGAETESFLTGPEALKTVSRSAREEILALFPQARLCKYPPRYARFVPPGRRLKQLMLRHQKSGKRCLNL